MLRRETFNHGRSSRNSFEQYPTCRGRPPLRPSARSPREQQSGKGGFPGVPRVPGYLRLDGDRPHVGETLQLLLRSIAGLAPRQCCKTVLEGHLCCNPRPLFHRTLPTLLLWCELIDTDPRARCSHLQHSVVHYQILNFKIW